jgi:hypothetical protein
VLAQLQHLVPSPKEQAEKTAHNGNGHAGKGYKPKVNSLLGSLLTVLVSRLDLTRLITELSKNVMAKTGGGGGKANGHEPSVSVADVGTIKPDQMEDFQ